ncbi:MAG: glycosyltransferase [Nitrospirae bacterium]|nr:glycosyltransferase [Nitrospirota bacterium]
MLENENIICLSWLVWDSIPLVMHHMMAGLSKTNRVLFVDPPVAYSNLIVKPTLLKNHFKKTIKWLTGVHRANKNLYIYYPPPIILQYGHFKIIDNLNQFIIAKAIKKTSKLLGFKSPILWIYHPYAINLNFHLNQKLVCYDCNDDVGYFFSLRFNKRKRLSEMEADLTKKADIVFTTSKYLYNLRRFQNNNTYYLPSAIDSEIFRKALSPEFDVASELEALQKPIIGFVGGISNSRMNWEWIRDSAKSHPEWSFVFVGPCVEPPPSYIMALKNIVFFGAKPYNALPSYIKGFDVCLIPYKGEEFLKACQPTKAFEYLSLGKPVVSSWIPELEDHQKIIKLSRNKEEFIKNIESALIDVEDEKMISLYIQSAKGYTWDDRIKKASELIETTIKNQTIKSDVKELN